MITREQWNTFCDRVMTLQSFGYNLYLDDKPLAYIKWGDVELRTYDRDSAICTVYKYPESCERIGNLKMLYDRISFRATMYDIYKNKVEVTDRNK